MASLKLTLTDANGEDLHDHVLVDLFSMHGSRQYQVTAEIERDIKVNGVDLSDGPFFRVVVTPANHRIIQFIVSFKESGATQFSAQAPVNPANVVTISGPPYSKIPKNAKPLFAAAAVPRFADSAGALLQGAALYAALDPYPLLKACVLNIIAKSSAIALQDGKTVLDHCLGLLILEQDRLFVHTTAELEGEAAHSNAFHAVDSSLHHPLSGYTVVSSYKTFDRYGNLQLTFQQDSSGAYVADIDIDDAQGIEHVFQVVRNSIQGPTNPYDIRDILLMQSPAVDPGYEFEFGTKLTPA